MRFWIITCSVIAEVCILLSISIYDIKRRKIKNSALALLLIIRTTQLIAIDSLDGVIYSVIGIIFVTGIVIIAKRFLNGIGQGDLKLCIVAGYIVGFKMLPVAFTVSTLVILLFALIKKGKDVTIPYGPFASIGIIMSIPSMLLR